MGHRLKVLGATLLIAGTTIGAGMLALPVITAFAGFFPSLLLMLFVWLVMLSTAFFFLDVNLAVRGEPNLISMAGRTLGKTGKAFTWIFYLLLLYSLTAAYIAAGAPLFKQAILYATGYEISDAVARFILPIFFAGFIYLGTIGVDWINRLLMVGLVVSYFLLVMFVPPYIQPQLYSHVDFPALKLAVTVVFTSFGFHIVIPSLTTYLDHNAKQLKIAILVGSTIPLIVYILWQLIVLGAVPLDALQQAWARGDSATTPLAAIVQSPFIARAAQFFSFFAIVTSFLGVALSLSDFLTDGFKLKKSWEGRLIAIAVTFAPPLFFVFAYQRGFYLALQHAGALVAILLGILPAMMAWTLKEHRFYRTGLGRALLIAVILVSVSVIFFDIFAT